MMSNIIRCGVVLAALIGTATVPYLLYTNFDVYWDYVMIGALAGSLIMNIYLVVAIETSKDPHE